LITSLDLYVASDCVKYLIDNFDYLMLILDYPTMPKDVNLGLANEETFKH